MTTSRILQMLDDLAGGLAALRRNPTDLWGFSTCSQASAWNFFEFVFFEFLSEISIVVPQVGVI